MRLLRSTPVYFVDAIEPQLGHWTGLGYEKSTEVPHGDRLGFVILERDGQEIMLQSHASAGDDFPTVAREVKRTGVAFFHEVDEVAAVQDLLGKTKLLSGPRDTPYGMREIFVLDPAGFVHAYAEKLG